MRILHVVTLVDGRSSYGGPLTVAINQCAELRRCGHDARIVAGWRGDGAPPTELEGVPAHLFPTRNVLPGMRFSGLFSLSLVSWLRWHAKTFDVAHVHFARDLVPLSATLVLRRSGIPYVTQTHGMVLPDDRWLARLIDKLLTVRLLREATQRFVLTADEDAALAAVAGPDVSRQVLANGVVVSDAPANDEARPVDILFLARLHPRKRVMDFANAARTLIEEGVEARFSVVGPDDGDLPALNAFLRSYPSVANQFRYEGPLPHERALARLAKASVFVLPSVDEPFPMTLLEALALGKPAVCTTGCGVAIDLASDKAAVVVSPGATNLAVALRGLIRDDASRVTLGHAGRRVALARFSLEAVAARLLETYPRPTTVPA